MSDPRPVVPFQRQLAPRNLLTVAEYRRFAREVGMKSWLTAAKMYARKTGAAVVLKADGSLLTLCRSGDKVLQKTYPAGSWEWAVSA